MKLTPFKEWQQSKAKNTELDKEVMCPDCQGEGVVAEECPCCGQYTEEHCMRCHGDGGIDFRELSATEKINCFDKGCYNAQVLIDLKKIALWEGAELVKVAGEHGYLVSKSLTGNKIIRHEATQ